MDRLRDGINWERNKIKRDQIEEGNMKVVYEKWKGLTYLVKYSR